MRCSRYHDPHVTPTDEEAPAFYRSKCLTCHQSNSCTLPLSKRQQTEPVDYCIACHMPKHSAPKLVKIGGKGTSHRILRSEDEPIPPMDAPQTSVDPQTGLILIDSDSASSRAKLPKVVLLKAYQSVLARDKDADGRLAQYQDLLQEMKNDSGEPFVFNALAESELKQKTAEGNRQAIHDLDEAIRLDTNSPRGYMMLSELQYRANNIGAAIMVLSTALAKLPYLPTPYENLAIYYLQSGDTQKAAEVVRRGLSIFPADQNLILLAGRIHP